MIQKNGQLNKQQGAFAHNIKWWRIATIAASCAVYFSFFIAVFWIKPMELKNTKIHETVVSFEQSSAPAQIDEPKPVVDEKILKEVQKQKAPKQYQPPQKPIVKPTPINESKPYDPYLNPVNTINSDSRILANNTPEIRSLGSSDLVKPTESAAENSASRQSSEASNESGRDKAGKGDAPPYNQTKSSHDTQVANAKQKYIDRVLAKVERNKSYPMQARDMGFQGTAILLFKLDKNGRLISVRVVKSSGKKILDDAAIMAVRDAASFEKFPSDLQIETLNIETPIEFSLKA